MYIQYFSAKRPVAEEKCLMTALHTTTWYPIRISLWIDTVDTVIHLPASCYMTHCVCCVGLLVGVKREGQKRAARKWTTSQDSTVDFMVIFSLLSSIMITDWHHYLLWFTATCSYSHPHHKCSAGLLLPEHMSFSTCIKKQACVGCQREEERWGEEWGGNV